MSRRVALGRQFGWLWAAYAVSAYGTTLGFGAFALIAIQVLDASPAQVSALSAAGLAVGALLAVPLGPWVEFHRKRPVMIAMDMTRFAALITIPVAYVAGILTFAQLMVVSIVVAASKIAFNAASGAFLKTLVPGEDLLIANARFESTTWSATIVGPALGGAAIGVLGPVVTIAADASSYLLSALGITAIGGAEQPPAKPKGRFRGRDLIEGWRYILRHETLRPLFLNVMAVNGLIMATEPLLAVLMLGPLGFPAWQYGLAFAVPCLGGLVGARLSGRVVARCGEQRVLRVFGALRACWPLGLAFIGPGIGGLLVVMITEFCLILSIGLFNPVSATYRLRSTESGVLARVLAAWSITGTATIAAATAIWGVLATVTSPRAAIAAAGVLLLATPLLLPRMTARRDKRGSGSASQSAPTVDELSA
ncbi:MFS transporter [Nocardia sp. NPDC059180]|uniref:MFS transporter n=1 Tax=Nocardia sp. NPDC059180 TaxID=3346761 RepID=UPI0036B92785